MKKIKINFLLAALLVTMASNVSAAQTVNVALFSWPSYGFWFIAKEKNLAPELNLNISIIEDPYEIYGQMAAGRIDVASSTMEYGPIAADKNIPIKVVTQTDISYGADKIIVGPGIKSAKDLIGKSVAVLEGGLTQIYMAVWLEKNGVKYDQVKYLNVIMDDAAAAMVNGSVKAGELWNPFAGKVLSTVKGSKVISNSLDPYWIEAAFIADGIYMSDKFTNKNPALAAKALKAYWDAVEYWKKHPDEGNAIIARNLGFKVSDVEDVIGKDGKPKEGGLAVFDLAGASRFMGVAAGAAPLGLKNGKTREVWALTVDWWKKFGLVKGTPKFEQGVNLAPMKAIAK
jgi:NitT/TauT family transport system substrate-binding protein